MTTATSSTSSFPEPAETEDQLRERIELLTSRCADLDEEQLVQKLAENTGRSEEAWQASLLLEDAPPLVIDFVPETRQALHPRHVSGHHEDGRAHTFSQQNHAARGEDGDVGVQLAAVAPSSRFRPVGDVATVEIDNATIDNPLCARQRHEHSLHPPPASRLPLN
jgi:hypothetical protein